MQKDDDGCEDAPLFMTRPPSGTNSACDALAAMIDEDDAAPTQNIPARRKRGLGELQVHMALTSVDDSSCSKMQKQRGKVDAMATTDDAVSEPSCSSGEQRHHEVQGSSSAAARMVGFNAGARAAAMTFSMSAKPWAS